MALTIVIEDTFIAPLDVLIPDLGTETWPQVRVAPDGEWHDLGPMHLIE